VLVCADASEPSVIRFSTSRYLPRMGAPLRPPPTLAGNGAIGAALAAAGRRGPCW